jgi:hypothetical protein
VEFRKGWKRKCGAVCGIACGRSFGDFEPEFSLFLRVTMPSAFSCVPEFQIQTSLWKEWEIATSCPSRYLKSIAEIQRQKNQRSGGVGGRISVFGHGLFRPGRAAACGAQPLARRKRRPYIKQN